MRTLKLVLAAIPLVAVCLVLVYVAIMSLYMFVVPFLVSLDGSTVLEYIGLWVLIMWIVWGVRYISDYRDWGK